MGLLEDYLAAAQQQVLADRNAALGGATAGGAVQATPAAPSNLDAILTQMASQIPTGGTGTPLTNQYANRTALAGQTSPAGTIATTPQIGGLYGSITSDPTTSALLAQRLQEAAVSRVLRSAGLGQLTPQPFGSTGGSPEGTGPGGRGGTDTSSIGNTANTGGVMSSAISPSGIVSGGFSALAGQPTSDAPLDAGQIAAVTGVHPAVTIGADEGPLSTATLGVEGFGPLGINPSSDLGQSMAEAIDSSSAVTGVLGGINIGVTASGEQVSVNPSTGVVSVGGEPVGVIGGETDGGGGATGGGGYGGEGMGIGLGGVADGSSNAGIGGPAGTGAVGGAGDAGQGTGGPGEGDQFGNQYVVGGRGPPDSKRVGLTVSPGELITVTPPGDPKGRGLDDILRIMATMRRG